MVGGRCFDLQAEHVAFASQTAESVYEKHGAEDRENQHEPRFTDGKSSLNVRIENVELRNRRARKATDRDESYSQLGCNERNGQGPVQCADVITRSLPGRQRQRERMRGVWLHVDDA